LARRNADILAAHMTDAISFDASEPLPLTGERTAPGIPEENYWFQRHVIAYQWALPHAEGKRVLDAGCGEGYGADLLAKTASAVVAVDYEEPVIHRAQALYPRVSFQQANLVALPFDAASFDVVVSLQVIEHLHSPQEFLTECRRVLRPHGTLILSTPNRLTFSPEGLRNPFHTFEFAPDELRATIARAFGSVELFGTFHGGRLRAFEATIRQGLPERLIAQPAPDWPDRLRAKVGSITPEDFVIRDRKLDESLDLIAIART
jgi:SAM-dependent methyltransferase